MGKNLKGGAEHLPPLSEQDRVKWLKLGTE